MPTLTGHFLVASPQLADPNFAQAVVLMLRHEASGALGTVLTRPGETTVREAWELIELPPCNCNEPLYQGGPVPGPMIAIHDQPRFSESDVLPGVYMSMQRDAIDQLIREPHATFRLFTGHSGWGGGQLEGEIEAGGWLKCPASLEEVFSDVQTLWKRLTSKIGIGIAAPQLDPRQIPDDPSLN